MATTAVKAYQLYINGQWQDAPGGKTFQVHNPATGELLAEVADGGKAAAETAIRPRTGGSCAASFASPPRPCPVRDLRNQFARRGVMHLERLAARRVLPLAIDVELIRFSMRWFHALLPSRETPPALLRTSVYRPAFHRERQGG